MKKVLTFSLLAALLCMVACNKTAAPESKEAPAVSAENGMLIVSVVPNDGAKATKADGNASTVTSESAITSLQVFVFHDQTDPALGHTAGNKETDRYQVFDGTDATRTLVLTTTVGMKRVYAVANAPRLTNVTTETDLKSRVLNLGNNYLTATSVGSESRRGLIMAGAYGYTSGDAAINVTATPKEIGAYTQGNDATITSVPISLHRLSARIELQNINVNFKNTWMEGLTFTVKEIYLMNVPNGVYFTGQNAALLSTAGYWTNKHTLDATMTDNAGNGVSSLIYELRPSGGTVCNNAGSDTSIGSYFYSFPNPSTAVPTSAAASTWSQRRTNLVIHAQISGSNATLGTDYSTPQDTWYAFPIADPKNFVTSGSSTPSTSATHSEIVGNHKYVIGKVNITGMGGPFPPSPQSSGKASIEVTVQDWNGTTVLGYDL